MQKSFEFHLALREISAPPDIGPGTELKRLLSGFGIDPDNCACNTYGIMMDAWGTDQCEARMPEIVSHLVSQANERGWMRLIPLKAFWAEELVKTAIENSRKHVTSPIKG